MSTALIVDAVVHKGQIRILDLLYKARAERACKKWGEGTSLTVRVEPEADARTYGQMKYWHGYVLAPLVDYTGDHDWRLYLKAMFLPEGKRSLTELTYEEMRAFTEQSQSWAHENCPEAYERYGREYVA